MSAAEPLRPNDSPFSSEDEAATWMRLHQVEHLSVLGLGVLAPQVEPHFLPQFRTLSARRRLIELLYSDGIEKWARETLPAPKMRAQLPVLAREFLESERREANGVRQNISDRLSPPLDERTHLAHQLLIQKRAQVPSHLTPRSEQALAILSVTDIDENLPGFRFRESRAELSASASLGLILPEFRLVFSPTEVTTQCSCGRTHCVHQLAAVDKALIWLKQPWSEAFGETVEALTRPSWERTLRALSRVVEGRPESSAKVEVSWRLRVIRHYGVEVAAYVHRRNKKGQRSAGAKVSRRRLLQEYSEFLSPTDLRLTALLGETEGPASRALLLELVDHPNIGCDDSPERKVRVERAKVGLLAEERGQSVIVTAGVDGAPLPFPMLETLKKAPPDEAVYLWEEGTAKLTLLDVPPDMRAMLAVLSKHDNAFPPESYGALLEQLSKLSLRMPVALPRSVMGLAVSPNDFPVLRFETQSGGAVRMEIRIRTLVDSPAFLPGEGPRDVHVRREVSAVHAVRNFEKETEIARTLRSQLPLLDAEPEENEFAVRFPSAQGALSVLSATQSFNPKPELEWTQSPLKLLSARGPGALKVVLERKRDWFGVLGGLSVEGERVELARLLDAAKRKERFVHVAGHSYIEIEEALRLHLEKLSDHTYAGRNGLEVGPSAAETLMALENAGADVEADKTWKKLAERIFLATELHPEIPSSLKAELRSYQAEGFRWLCRLSSWGAGGILADDMGLGKTVEALAVLLERSQLGPALVLAPTSVAFNWIDEAKRFAPSLKMHLYADADDRGGTLEKLRANDVLVLSYGLLTRDIERLSSIRFSTIVFDEAQTLKNALTHRFRAAKALQGDFKFALSGTPLENHLGELWSLFACVFPGLLGSWESFRVRFANPIERQVDPTAAPALARVLQPFLLRRTKAQVEAQLPPRTEIRVPVVLSSGEWTLYEDARLAALSDLETKKSKLKEQERRIEILAALTRLRLLASHPRLYDPTSKLESSKLERLMELIEELRAEGQRALVFSQFTSHLALVREVLDAKSISYEYLDGQTPQSARAERVRAFQEGNASLFLISLKAGGFGLNLTAATSVIHLDPWWNPAVEDQASDRAHRIGQTKPVTVYRLVARGTIEEQMLSLHQHKRSLVAGVLEGKDLAGKLSSRELLDLLSQKATSADGQADEGRTLH